MAVLHRFYCTPHKDDKSNSRKNHGAKLRWPKIKVHDANSSSGSVHLNVSKNALLDY